MDLLKEASESNLDGGQEGDVGDVEDKAGDGSGLVVSENTNVESFYRILSLTNGGSVVFPILLATDSIFLRLFLQLIHLPVQLPVKS